MQENLSLKNSKFFPALFNAFIDLWGMDASD